MFLFSLIIFIGIIFIILGILIWKKQKISLFNKNINIDEKNIIEYSKSIGKSYIIIGLSTFMLGGESITDNEILRCILPVIWILAFSASLVKVNKTQKKYKVGIWS